MIRGRTDRRLSRPGGVSNVDNPQTVGDFSTTHYQEYTVAPTSQASETFRFPEARDGAILRAGPEERSARFFKSLACQPEVYTQSHKMFLLAAILIADFILAVGFLYFNLEQQAERVQFSLTTATACVGLFCFANWASGAYDTSLPSAVRSAAATVARNGIVATLAVAGIAWEVRHFDLERFAVTGIIASMLAAGSRVLLLSIKFSNAARTGERLLLVGAPRSLNQIAGAPPSRSRMVLGCITVGEAAETAFPRFAHIDLGGQPLNDESLCMRRPRPIDRIVIIGAGLGEATFAAVVRALEHVSFEISLAPTTISLFDHGSILHPSNCIRLRRPAATLWEHLSKRTLDLVVATILLILLTPTVLLPIAVLIRLESPGSVLFRQTRWGRNNETFTIYKFRSMWADAPGADGSQQATPGDRRITRLGAFLRRTSLDELPQLLNVIEGTMSLVGPRPHPVELNRRFIGVVDRYLVRHRVLPGITGLAQVNGCRGETKSTAAMQQRIRYDLEYVRSHCFSLDLWILARTIGVVLRRVNAY
jgi:exopolysaccharide biosynthesis polyprenyl glycosylphosphotransferase